MYRADNEQMKLIGCERSLDPYFGRVTRGLNSSDDDRFLRLFWEVAYDLMNTRWYFCAKGAEYMWFFPNICTVIDWLGNGMLIEAHTANVSENVAQAIGEVCGGIDEELLGDLNDGAIGPTHMCARTAL
jgi:hypothetical protein